MTRGTFKQIWLMATGALTYNKAVWKENRDFLMNTHFVNTQFLIDCWKVKTMKDCCKSQTAYTGGGIVTPISPYITLGDCKPVYPPCVEIPFGSLPGEYYNEKQGNNPMRIDTTTAIAYVTAAKSDEAFQRDYLLSEWSKSESWRDEKPHQIRKLFNLDAPLFPKSSQELIDAFANSKYTVDTAKVALNTAAHVGDADSYDANGDYTGRQFYGITFTDLPVADRTGYDAAIEAYEKLKVDTKRKIIVGTPADGLAALEALEAWMPTTPAN